EECDNKKELVKQLKEARKRITSLERDNQQLEICDERNESPIKMTNQANVVTRE
ncbi:unnamed protein product, partial [Dovyalis caffra]